MNNTNLFSTDTLKLIYQGILFTFTFGIYNGYTNIKNIESIYKNFELQNYKDNLLSKNNLQCQTEINNLRERINNLEKKI
jgi:hypothetical protein